MTATKVNAFQCPSDTNPGNLGTISAATMVMATSNYMSSSGSARQYFGSNITGPTWYLGGNSQVGRVVTLASVRDGTSNTAVFSEIVKGNQGANKPISNVCNNSPPTGVGAAGSDYADYQACMAGTWSTMWDYKGEYWTCMDAGRGGTYSHTMPPNTKSCNYGTAYDNRICASSYHSGGVNLLCLDGSVKFVKNSVSYPAWLGLGTVAGGEVIDANALQP